MIKEKLEKLIKSKSLPYVLLVIVAISITYQYVMTLRVDGLKKDLEAKNQVLEEQVAKLEQAILDTQETSNVISETLKVTSEEAKRLIEEFEEVNDNVEDLEKITTTDKELLQKYSKVFFLNEHYYPTDLETIDSKWTYDEDREYQIHADVWPHLEDLLKEAEEDNVDLQVISAFRSFDEQAQLKGAYTVTYGSGANTFSADQGYSEHQLGTTVDFTNTEVGVTFSGFAQTEAYEWLQENAYRYGFVLSYPENNQYYEFEPWHWRYVGSKLARKLDRNDQYFYDLPQREIDEYILYLFD